MTLQSNKGKGKEASTDVQIVNDASVEKVITDERYLKGLRVFAESIYSSASVPQEKPEDVIAAILYGNELGIPPMVSINHIHSVNGRAGVGVNIIQSKLLGAGIRYEVIDDFKALYQVVRRKADGTDYTPPVIYPNQDEAPSLSEIDGDKLIKGVTIVDRVTRIKFTRMFQGERVTHVESYYWSDAAAAKLTDKHNWKAMPKLMLKHRCLTQGARFFANDILMGMYEMSELADSSNTPYNITDEGEVTILDSQGNEIKKRTQPNVSDEVIDNNSN